MNGSRRLALVGATAAAAMSLGTGSVSAAPTPAGSCHGFFASAAAHELGGIGRGFQELGMSPTEIGEAQHALRDLCRDEAPE
jgi:hypothetical protein